MHLEQIINELITTSGENIYEHYKGGGYKIVLITTEEATGDLTVVYKSLKDGRLFSRPLDVFFEYVTEGGDDYNSRRRFKPVP